MKQTFWEKESKRNETTKEVKLEINQFKKGSNQTLFMKSRHLVEEVLHEFGDAYVVIVSVDEQHLLEVFELWDGVVAVPHCLTTLLTHDPWRGR